jgi:hypothetical protein
LKVSYYRDARLALLAGGVTGVLVLGIAGGAAMAAVAFITGNPLNLSLMGLLEVAVVGMLVGAVGGILLVVVRRIRRAAGLTRGALVGATLFVCTLLVSWVSGRIDFGVPTSLLTFFVGAIVFVVYGVGADALLTRFNSGAEEKN